MATSATVLRLAHVVGVALQQRGHLGVQLVLRGTVAQRVGQVLQPLSRSKRRAGSDSPSRTSGAAQPGHGGGVGKAPLAS
jgi:hypothetical protein